MSCAKRVEVAEETRPERRPLVEVKEASVVFGRRGGQGRSLVALDSISMSIPAGRPAVYTIAGESGSGKSTLGLMLLGLQPPTSGSVEFSGMNIYGNRVINGIRLHREVQAVFQNPFEAFNPFYRIEHMFELLFRRYLRGSRHSASTMVADALHVVGLEPGHVLGKYPHQLSGGQLQRITLARVLLLRPKLLIADEPVSMIDASLRALVLEEMLKLKDLYDVTIVYITHDLSTALQVSDRIQILLEGRIVEEGPAEEVILNPKHAYTQELIDAIPVPDPNVRWGA